MRTLARLGSFRALQATRQHLLVEALLVGTFAYGLIRLVPYRAWPSWVLGEASPGQRPHQSPHQSPHGADGDVPPLVIDLRWAVRYASKLYGERLRCLAQAITASLMLRRRGIGHAIYFGVKPGGAARAAAEPALAAHAWVRIGNTAILGLEELPGHVPVASYHFPAKAPAAKAQRPVGGDVAS